MWEHDQLLFSFSLHHRSNVLGLVWYRLWFTTVEIWHKGMPLVDPDLLLLLGRGNGSWSDVFLSLFRSVLHWHYG